MGRSVLRLKSRKTRRNNNRSKRFLNKNKNKRSRRVLRKRTRKRKFLGGTRGGSTAAAADAAAAAAAEPRAAEPGAAKHSCGKPAKKIFERKPGMKGRPGRPVTRQRDVVGGPPPVPPYDEGDDDDEELGLRLITKDGKGEDILMDPRELFGEPVADEPRYVNAQAIEELEKAQSEDMFSTIVRKLSRKEQPKEPPQEPTKPEKIPSKLGRRQAFKAKSKYQKKTINKLIVTLTTITDNNSSDAFYRKFQHDLDGCEDQYVMKISITALLNNFYSILTLFNFTSDLVVVFTGHGGKNVTTVSGDTAVADECSASTELKLDGFQTKLPKYNEILKKTEGMITDLEKFRGASIVLLFGLLEELHKKFEITYTIIFYICKGAYTDEGGNQGLCTRHFPKDTTEFTFLKNATLYCNENNVPRMGSDIYSGTGKTGLDVISEKGIAVALGKDLGLTIATNLQSFFGEEFKLEDTGQDKFNWTKYTYLGNSLESVLLNEGKGYSVNTLQGLLTVIYG